MKKQVLIAVAILASAFTYAQTDDNWHQLQIGARAGVNFSSVTGDDIDSPDSRTNFYGGLVAEAPISRNFSIQPEVFYSGQGFDITEEENQVDAEFQVDYIQVPLLAKVYLTEGLNLHAGPQLGFKVNEEVDFEPFEDEGDFDTDEINAIDFQLTGGAEYKFNNGFFLQARYSYGLSEVIEDSDIHNSVFSAGLGYMF
ncbi:porin family protein [Galbibacter mesophilus]|uniref:porin family protein n=1 Tax=Galbibacter mesophilus TaxID=379069 RepID=UPI00191CAA64|nr:porin family protein [Galbibacter mesophilus]MCM5663694.1 PorT family protein [Galbibacter mesophilus]